MKDDTDRKTAPFDGASPPIEPAPEIVTFSGTIGLFKPAQDPARSAEIAALFLSPWGLEEMCVRKAWRELCDRLSAIGVPSLRFDYPGTGDALDVDDFSSGLKVWEDAAVEAALRLQRHSGCRRILLVAQGLGSLVAGRLRDRIAQIEGGVLMAPVTSGRRYLREVSLWSKVVDEGLGLPARETSDVSIAGLRMPDELAQAIRKTDLADDARPTSGRWLVCERPGSEAEADLSARLAAGGADVERLVFNGYAALVSNPTIAETPVLLYDRIVAWIDGMSGPRKAAAPIRGAEAVELLDRDFIERPVRFGVGNRLFGIVCQPVGRPVVGSILLMGAGCDRQAGWARSAVETARDLAASGIASLRFDAANIGDSPPLFGHKRQVLYAPEQVADSKAALDLMEELGLTPAVLVGRCSGAYLAFHTALQDIRCRAVIAVNILVFAWDPRDRVDEIVRYNPRSLTEYKRRALTLDTAYRLILGKVDLTRAARNILKMAARRATKGLSSVLGELLVETRLRNSVLAAFRSFEDRQVPISLIYSENDIGLARLNHYFGPGGAFLSKYGNVSLSKISQADHNVTPVKARGELRAHIRDTVLATRPLESQPKTGTAWPVLALEGELRAG